MKYIEKSINTVLFDNNNYIVYDYKEINNEIFIYLKSKNKKCKCTKCGCESDKLHSTYVRKIQDTPLHNKTTWLLVNVYEFECINPMCNIKTFNETLGFAKKYQVMTNELIQLILCTSIFLSNSSASLVLSLIGVKVSADTIKNIYNKIEIYDDKNIEEIGIDDVAIRKGIKYATVIYNLKNHNIVALLENRDASNVKMWLKDHPKVKIVARDRACAYATAISEILPNCLQVADRYHLFENIFEYLKDIFYKDIPDKIFIQNDEIIDEKQKRIIQIKKTIPVEELEKMNYDNNPPVDSLGNIIEYDDKRREFDSKQYIQQDSNRIEKYNKIKFIREDYKNNNDLKYLAKKHNVSIPSIRKYVKLSEEEIENIKVRTNYKKRKTVADNYKNIIYKMLQANKSFYEIVNYCIYKGYDKGLDSLKQYIYIITKNNFPDKNPKDYFPKFFYKYVYPDNVTVITKGKLLKHILTVNPNTKKDETIEKYLYKIKEKYLIVNEVQTIFREYHAVIMGKNEFALDNFLEKYETSCIKSLCKGIKKDITAVKKAISSPISSGFVEGNNNKFKLIKRIVYGKMNLVNLFQKCFLAFSVTKDDFSVFDLI